MQEYKLCDILKVCKCSDNNSLTNKTRHMSLTFLTTKVSSLEDSLVLVIE